MALDDARVPPPDPADGRAGHEDDELLPCGASLALLWENGRAPGHVRCPHCADALAGLGALDRTVRAAVAAADDAPSAAALAARVMDLVRTELRPGPLVPLAEPDGWITGTAAARLFRRAAESVPGVQAGSCRITPLAARGPAPRGGRLPREPLRVRLELAVDLSLAVPEVGEAVRACVLAVADAQVGLDLARIDIAVVDVLDVPDASGACGVPDARDASDVPVVPDGRDVPEAAVVPDGRDVPGTADPSGAPTTADVPPVADEPYAPDVPPVADEPYAADMPRTVEEPYAADEPPAAEEPSVPDDAGQTPLRRRPPGRDPS